MEKLNGRAAAGLSVVPLVLLLLLAAGACGGEGASDEPSPTADSYQGMVFTEPLPKPHFTLTDIEGQPYDFFEETRGYVTLLYFGYTFCADVCPTHMANVAAVLKRDPELAKDVKVVFVTVDPERDTPKRLSDWLGLFEAGIVGLTGTPEEVDGALKASLGSQYFAVKTFEKDSPEDMRYTVSHAAFVLAYSKTDIAPVAFPLATTQQEYAHDLNRLLSEGES
jgi:protein SCO1/2